MAPDQRLDTAWNICSSNGSPGIYNVTDVISCMLDACGSLIQYNVTDVISCIHDACGSLVQYNVTDVNSCIHDACGSLIPKLPFGNSMKN